MLAPGAAGWRQPGERALRSGSLLRTWICEELGEAAATLRSGGLGGRDSGPLVSHAPRNLYKCEETPILLHDTEVSSHSPGLMNGAVEQRVVQTGRGNGADWKCCELSFLTPTTNPSPVISRGCCACIVACGFPPCPGAGDGQAPRLAGAVWLNQEGKAVLGKKKGLKFRFIFY